MKTLGRRRKTNQQSRKYGFKRVWSMGCCTHFLNSGEVGGEKLRIIGQWCGLQYDAWRLGAYSVVQITLWHICPIFPHPHYQPWNFVPIGLKTPHIGYSLNTKPEEKKPTVTSPRVGPRNSVRVASKPSQVSLSLFAKCPDVILERRHNCPIDGSTTKCHVKGIHLGIIELLTKVCGPIWPIWWARSRPIHT